MKILKKTQKKYHKLVENKYIYIMPFENGDVDGYIYVNNYGLIPLTESGQLTNAMEFYNGKMVAY